MTNTKRDELKDAVGREMSHNYSPTLRAKLVKVNKVTCVLEVTKGQFVDGKDYTVGMRFKDNIYSTWNALFY